MRMILISTTLRLQSLSFCVLMLMLQSVCTSQNIWLGSTPGMERNWECAENWSTGKVPGESDRVIIPMLVTKGEWYPEIKSSTDPIASLLIHSGSMLSITREGTLTIDGSSTFDYGVINLGTIMIEGDFQVMDTGLEAILNEGLIIDTKARMRSLESNQMALKTYPHK